MLGMPARCLQLRTSIHISASAVCLLPPSPLHRCPMPAQPGPTSQEGYPSSSPSVDAHSNDPFNSGNRRYYDNESDHVEYGRRDYRETYASNTSNSAVNDYDQNGTYEYRKLCCFFACFLCLTLSHLWFDLQHCKIPTPTPMSMDSVQRPRQNPPPGSRIGYDSLTPTFMENGGPAGAWEAYTAWSAERRIPYPPPHFLVRHAWPDSGSHMLHCHCRA
jgi:1,3-beta-glucan synthase